MQEKLQSGFVAVYTLQEAIAILADQSIPWKYAHRPLLDARSPFDKPVDSFFVYFVNEDGDEVAAWSLKLSSLQLFRPPRKVNRHVFPDGPTKVYVGGEIPRFI
jgi:hypothetical protein